MQKAPITENGINPLHIQSHFSPQPACHGTAPDWLIPAWTAPAPQGVRAVFTTRTGGVSQPPWDTMNLGAHVGDAPASVAANRARLAAMLGVELVFVHQVHGWSVANVDAQWLAQPCSGGFDALITSRARVGCAIMVADCLPLLWAHRQGWCVGAVHAGWRGLAGQGHGGGVIEHFWRHWCAAVRGEHALRSVGQSPTPSSAPSSTPNAAVLSDADIAADTCVWLGPCIGPAAFEVGEDVRSAFITQAPTPQQRQRIGRCFTPTGQHAGKYWANLPQLARLRLAALGIANVAGNDGSAPWCTAHNQARYFSHRRDAAAQGSTGRMAAIIWRE